MNKLNMSRVLLLWLVSVIPMAIICFLILMLLFVLSFLNNGLPLDDISSPATGFLLIFYGMVSCLIGFWGAIPFALFVEYIFLSRTRSQENMVRASTYLF